MSDPKQLVPEGIKIRGKHGLKIEDVRKEIELGFVKRFFKYHKKELKNDLDKLFFNYIKYICESSVSFEVAHNAYFQNVEYHTQKRVMPQEKQKCKKYLQVTIDFAMKDFLSKKSKDPKTVLLPENTIHLYCDDQSFDSANTNYWKDILTEMRSFTSTVFHVNCEQMDNQTLQNLLQLDQGLFNNVVCTDRYSAFSVPVKNSTRKKSEFRLATVIQAYAKADEFMQSLQNKDLSPLEKYILIHDYVANNYYNEGDKIWDADKCRSFVGSMTSNEIVCVGYAMQMAYFCNQAGIDCQYVTSANIQKPNKCGHAFNMVHIKDDKYKVDSTYLCDACWDYKEKDAHGLKSYLYAFLPIQDIQYDKHQKYYSKELKQKYNDIQSDVLDLSKIHQAISNAYKKIDNFDRISVIKDLEYTTQNTVYFLDNLYAQNCFSRHQIFNEKSKGASPKNTTFANPIQNECETGVTKN